MSAEIDGEVYCISNISVSLVPLTGRWVAESRWNGIAICCADLWSNFILYLNIGFSDLYYEEIIPGRGFILLCL